jgi:hypothetical protein
MILLLLMHIGVTNGAESSVAGARQLGTTWRPNPLIFNIGRYVIRSDAESALPSGVRNSIKLLFGWRWRVRRIRRLSRMVSANDKRRDDPAEMTSCCCSSNGSPATSNRRRRSSSKDGDGMLDLLVYLRFDDLRLGGAVQRSHSKSILPWTQETDI